MLRADLLRPLGCRSALLAAAFVFVLSGRSLAAPLCASDSLTNYLSLGSCSIGAATFSDFSLVTPLPHGRHAHPHERGDRVAIQYPRRVSDSSSCSMSRPAPFQLNELLFGYFASAPGFTDVTLAMPGASATGDGVVTAVQDVCIGGAFTPGSLAGCPTSQDANVAFAIDGAQSLSETLSFAATPLLGIINDIAVDGGLGRKRRARGGESPIPSPSRNRCRSPRRWMLLGTGITLLLRSRRRSPNF